MPHRLDGFRDHKELIHASDALTIAVATLRQRGLFDEARAEAIMKRLAQLCLSRMADQPDPAALAEIVAAAFLEAP